MRSHARHLGLFAVCACVPVFAQQPAQKAMGSVPTVDAKLSGGLEVSDARARLISNANVTAYDHTAQVDLERGGLIAVCSTSSFHLLRSGSGDALLFALDRGAIEIRSRAQPQDAILTPDLRFTLLTPGTLDLRIRVTREGDTCVENRGDGAPVLQVTEGFGDGLYHLPPGQHVTFVHGSTKEVVGNERSNCGCPQPTPVMVASGTANGTSVVNPVQAEAAHPFPEAQSAGLAPENPKVPLPAATTGDTAALAYSPAEGPKVPASKASAVEPSAPVSAAGSPTGSGEGPAAPPPAPPGATDIMHRIGHFFKRLFGGK